jgi:hypothetical protein
LAIVAPGASLANFATLSALREAVPQIVVAEAADPIAYLRHSLPGVDAFILKSANDGALATLVSDMMALADNAAGECVPAPSIVYIGECKLDLPGYVFVTPDGHGVLSPAPRRTC